MLDKEFTAGCICLPDKREYIAEVLDVEPGSREYWHVYRGVITNGLISGKIRGFKDGKWFVNESDFENVLKEEAAKLKNKKSNTSTKSQITINEIKLLIEDMTSVGIEADKILTLLKKKIGL